MKFIVCLWVTLLPYCSSFHFASTLPSADPMCPLDIFEMAVEPQPVKLRDFSYQVLLESIKLKVKVSDPLKERKYCAGVIIHPMWILTAAQCVRDYDSTIVRAFGRTPEGQDSYHVNYRDEVVFYSEEDLPKYQYQFDIALVKLTKAFILGFKTGITAVQLPSEEPDVKERTPGQRMILVAPTTCGYYSYNSETDAYALPYVIVADGECERLYYNKSVDLMREWFVKSTKWTKQKNRFYNRWLTSMKLPSLSPNPPKEHYFHYSPKLMICARPASVPLVLSPNDTGAGLVALDAMGLTTVYGIFYYDFTWLEMEEEPKSKPEKILSKFLFKGKPKTLPKPDPTPHIILRVSRYSRWVQYVISQS